MRLKWLWECGIGLRPVISSVAVTDLSRRGVDDRPEGPIPPRSAIQFGQDVGLAEDLHFLTVDLDFAAAVLAIDHDVADGD